MARMNKIGSHKTSVKQIDNDLIVTYHSTEIVRANNTTITLNTGGWFTSTTKTRMNQTAYQCNLGYSVYQKKGVWYIDTPKQGTMEFIGNTITFNR